MNLDFRQLVTVMRRWWWLLLLIPLIAAGSSYLASSQQTPLYKATVTLRVTPPTGADADFNVLLLTQNLTETYRQMIVLTPVLDDARDTLNLPYDTDTLKGKLTAEAVPGTQLLRLTVSDADAQRAAIIANTVADAFVRYLSDQATTQVTETQATLNEQMATSETELASIRTRLAELDTATNAANATIQTEITDLRLRETRILQEQAALQAQMQDLDVQVASNQSLVTVSESATAARSPYAPATTFYVVLALAVGVAIAIATIASLEFFDSTLRAETDVPAITGVPVMAGIATVPTMEYGQAQVYTVTQPRSGAAEAIRLLRANLEFAAAAEPIRSLAITSAGPGEGKSTVAANLAVVMAQAGFATTLVDADLRRPTLHAIFGVDNARGLTTLLTNPNETWRSVATRVAVPNLSLIASGPVPPNPADLLSTDRYSSLITLLEGDSDIVIIDTPPVLAVSDPLLIGNRADAIVLLGKSRSTRVDRLRDAADSLRQAGVRIVGVVVNQQRDRDGIYDEYYGPLESPPETASRAPEGLVVRSETGD